MPPKPLREISESEWMAYYALLDLGGFATSAQIDKRMTEPPFSRASNPNMTRTITSRLEEKGYVERYFPSQLPRTSGRSMRIGAAVRTSQKESILKAVVTSEEIVRQWTAWILDKVVFRDPKLVGLVVQRLKEAIEK